MTCPKCGSENVNVQAVAELQKRGCLTTLFYIVLACTIVGIFFLIPMIRGQKTKTRQYALCQNCGHKWRVRG